MFRGTGPDTAPVGGCHSYESGGVCGAGSINGPAPQARSLPGVRISILKHIMSGRCVTGRPAIRATAHLLMFTCGNAGLHAGTGT